MVIKANKERKCPNIISSHLILGPGMKFVSDFLEGIKLECYKTMPDAIYDLFIETTSVSSTIYRFQIMDADLLNSLKESLQNDEKDF